MTPFQKESALAEKLESQYQWRRAARQWLVVLDIAPATNERLRDQIISRRARCSSYGNFYCGDYSGISEARLVDHTDMGVAA
ncbi:PerC family transcriptional regulator [Sodalis ligni]|uniref:PerC family transcriptional regulator n=1 Tax=Sodalis ligni TaxID=2697027 RepID=UPI00193FF3FB|nr:PerC family transcriptional regulator [Sodalis ligni]QWA09818.1 PerC family transcriptional regulator [Sodalis ligni]